MKKLMRQTNLTVFLLFIGFHLYKAIKYVDSNYKVVVAIVCVLVFAIAVGIFALRLVCPHCFNLVGFVFKDKKYCPYCGKLLDEVDDKKQSESQ